MAGETLRRWRSEWAENDTVLRWAQFGQEINTRRLKVGDGVTPWSELPWATSSPTTQSSGGGDSSSKVSKSGDTMTGPLTLSGPPTNSLHAATQQYVLDRISALTAGAPNDLNEFIEVYNRFLSNESNLSSLLTSLAGKQPSDPDLDAIAALTTTSLGRSLLAISDAAGGRSILGAASISALNALSDSTTQAIGLATGRTIHAVANAGSSQTLTVDGVNDLTLTSSVCALTMPSSTPQPVWDLTLVIREDASGGRDYTVPGNVTWLGDGNKPPTNTSPGGVTIVTFFTFNGGVSWYGVGTVEIVPSAHKANHAPGGVDALDYTLVHREGTLTNRPAASSANAGLYYNATDDRGGTLYRSDGTKWKQQSLPLGDSLRPAALKYSTFRRSGATTIQANYLVSGRRHMVAIDLPAGELISNILFVSGNTAMASGTAQWFELFDSSRNRLGITNDDGATAWGANTVKSLALTSAFTTTYSGLHYLGITVVATTVPALVGVSGSAVILAMAPALAGYADTGLTTAAAAPATAAAITTTGTAGQPYAGVS